MTLDQAIDLLTEAKKQAGGDATVTVSLSDNDLPDADFTSVEVVGDIGSHGVLINAVIPGW